MNPFCIQCGSPIEPGVRFCGTCGRPLEAMIQPVGAPPPPLPPRPMPPQQPMSPPPQYGAAPGTFGPGAGMPGTTFEIIYREPYRMAKITIHNSAVTLEAGQLHYMLGQIQMTAEGPSLGGLAKSFLTKEKAVRPVYSGSGEIYLEPTFGELNIMEIRPGETWVLDKGAYVASDQGIAIDMQTNPAFRGMLGGEGWFQTQVSGQGKVIYWSPGPVERIEIQGQTLTVDGSFAVARTGSLEYRVEKATKGLFKSWVSGEGLVSTFRGYGAVMLAPVPNLYTTVINQFGGLHAAIRSISRS